MSLNADDITNLERGIDAAISAVLGMARVAMVKINAEHGPVIAGPMIGFIQALVDNKHALGVKALQDAMVVHPDLEDAAVEMVAPE